VPPPRVGPRRSARPRPPAVSFERRGATIHQAPAETLYDRWPQPICIIADGPYGIAGYDGDPPTPVDLAAWYRPHIAAWTRRATPQTTLWFWGTEVGWAHVHGELAGQGWEYRSCHVWNKGLGHIAGNANSQTLRKFPVVTEICVQYVKAARFVVEGREVSMQDWLRHEWRRAGLPLSRANAACGVKNAATRKYLTACHLWYFPPAEAFERLAAYANRHGARAGRPYFSTDGRTPLAAAAWEKMRAKFHCEVGVTNLWSAPPLRGPERLKRAGAALHTNQKPRGLFELIIRTCTDRGDVVWEPFGGLCPGALASAALGRRYVGAEIRPEFYRAAIERLAAIS
jgi:DNA methylase